MNVLVVESLDEVRNATDGQVAIVLVASPQRDGGRSVYDRYVRVGGRWVRDEG